MELHFTHFRVKKSINELIYIFSMNDLNFYNSSVIIYLIFINHLE